MDKEAERERLRRKINTALESAYLLEAEISELDGDAVSEEFYLALAECYRTGHSDASTARKDAAYAALKSRNQEAT